MKLSIIVNHYHTPEILKICLRSVKENLKNADFAWEIIVTDGETIEKTTDMIETYFPEIIFIPFKENVGFGKLVNSAIAKSKGEYLFIINADLIVEEEKSVEKMLEYMAKHQDIGMLGPKLLNVNDTVQQSCFRFYTPLTIICRRTILGKTYFGKKILDNFLMKDVFDKKEAIAPISVDWLMGSAMMIKKSNLKKVGVLDENFFMYFEDVDWARRFWENSLKVVYFPNSVMYHYHFQSSKKKSLFNSLLSKYARIHIKSALKYFIKYKFKKAKYGI